MSIIQVNYGAMDAGVQQIRGTHSRLQAMFADLQAQVSQLAPTWDGTAQAAYLAVQQHWNTVNQSLHEGLAQMGTGVDTAHTNFRHAETTNTSGWGS
jgi:early secretory antigenic target protein ESAT-6